MLHTIKKPSPHFNDRPQGCPIDMIIIHAIGYDKERCLNILCGAPHEVALSGEVSAHYLIDEDGTIYALVEEDKRAWHAGISSWGERENLNHYSIGIELMNKSQTFETPFEDRQIEALIELIHDIKTRHPIQNDFILGHDQIAPERKADPGKLFPWDKIRTAFPSQTS